MTEVIDVAAPVETVDGERGVSLARHRALTNPLTPQLAVTVSEFRSMIAQRDEIMRNLLTDGVHYGSPKDKSGKPVFDKPSLLLPGAERLASVFGLALEHDDEHAPEIDLDGEHHYRNGEPTPYIGYTRRVRVYKYDANTGERICIGQYTGHANSWEDRYARDESPECPSCHERTVRRSKTEFYCWRKIGGCGETFRLDTEAITAQTVGRHVHPNPSDIQNTLIQIADKRAAVKAIRSVTGFSDLFTQDGEDIGSVPSAEAGDEAPPPTASPPARRAPRNAPEQTSAATTPPMTEERKALMAKVVAAYAAAQGEEKSRVLVRHHWTSAMSPMQWIERQDDDTLRSMLYAWQPEDRPDVDPPAAGDIDPDDIPFAFSWGRDSVRAARSVRGY